MQTQTYLYKIIFDFSMAITHILFDWGGVVCYHINNNFAALIAENDNVDPLTAMMVLEKYAPEYEVNKVPSREYWNRLIHELGLSLKVSELIELGLASLKLNIEVFEIITELKDKYTLGVISNNINEFTAYIRDNFELRPFDDLVFSNEVRMRKPKKGIYKEALNRLKVKPENAIFIDDLPVNVSAARELGINAVSFHDSLKLRNDLKKAGVRI